jgi:hypothetical protein
MKVLRKRHWLFLIVLTIIQLMCVGLVLYRSTSNGQNQLPELTAPLAIMALSVVSFLCIALFFSIVLFAFSSSEDSSSFRLWFHSRIRQYTSLSRLSNFIASYGTIGRLSALIIVVVLLLSLSLLTGWFIFIGEDVKPELMKSPGIPFALITGIISIAGFLITINKIKESHNFITNYQQLLDLAATRISTSKHAYMFCITPLHGNVSQSDSGLYKKFHDQLIAALKGDNGNQCELHIVCYKGSSWTDMQVAKSPLQLYYESLVPVESIKKGYEEALIFLSAMESKIDSQKKLQQADKSARPKIAHSLLEVVPTNSKRFPGYRALITDETAIIYLPIDISPPSGDASHHHFEMIGFETSTPYVVEWVKNQFKTLWTTYENDPNSSIFKVI